MYQNIHISKQNNKLILTPHIAGLSEESEKKLAKIISNKIKQI